MASADKPLYPLKFEPIYKEKVWGGRTLEKFGRTLPGDAKIGESWEVADLGATSVSGGGGGAERSRIRNGPLAGLTLHEAIGLHGERLLGRLQLTPTGDFPLLVKFLDAGDNLSVQVHPSPAYAREHPDAHLKSEAWYIIDAVPGSVIYKGVKEGTTPQQFREAIEQNRVEELMIAVPVKPGDCHYLPSGTCHALGAGILVAEVQTPSDTTYRVYDWGRTGRELHVEQALACIEFGPARTQQYEKRSHIAGMFTAVSHLVSCEYFRIEKVRMTEGYEQEIPYDQPTIWMVLDGRGWITPGGGAKPVDFQRGDTLLMPASCRDAHVRLDADTVWLEVTFPQAANQQLA
jgi:mannose-6-phosphate isomerase